jgi:hypothetical protein
LWAVLMVGFDYLVLLWYLCSLSGKERSWRLGQYWKTLNQLTVRGEWHSGWIFVWLIWFMGVWRCSAIR